MCECCKSYALCVRVRVDIPPERKLINVYTVYVLIEAQCVSARAWVRVC